MSELKELLEKVKLENIMAFMIYGADSRRDAFENYEKEIEKSYDEIFYRLEHLYSEADRKDDKLFDVLLLWALGQRQPLQPLEKKPMCTSSIIPEAEIPITTANGDTAISTI